MTERIQKLLSQWGIASRRQAEQLIEQGRVKVNGRTAKLGDKASLDCDLLQVDGTILEPESRPSFVYLLLNKPLGVLSTCADPQGRTTVIDLLPEKMRLHQGIHPVGRLDANSTGALFLTNDGDFTLKLTHPRYHAPKTYQVWLKGHPPFEVLDTWSRGVWLDGRKTRPALIKVLTKSSQNTLIEIILKEGRNRQIRRIAANLGFPVRQLHRLAIASISVADLQPGEYRHLSPQEIRDLLPQKYYNR